MTNYLCYSKKNSISTLLSYYTTKIWFEKKNRLAFSDRHIPKLDPEVSEDENKGLLINWNNSPAVSPKLK